MRITSQALELRMLKTLTSTSSRKQLARLSNILNPACFYSEIGNEVYSRVMTLAKDRGILIKWDELLTDPVLKESTRKYLRHFKKRPIKTLANMDGYIRQLHNYRQLRAIYFSFDYAVSQLKREKVDADKLYLDINERLSEARSGGSSAEWFTHVGQDDKEAKAFVKKLLSNKIRNIYIPTGIAAFDQRNIGIPRGSFFLIGSNTSGGKSVLANQLGGNMAEAGARVCVIQLEMDHIQTGQRHVSRISSTNMSRVIDPTKLSKRQKRKITNSWLRWHRRIKRNGGLLSTFAPEEDLTFEEILLILKPFDYDVIILDYIGLLKGVDEADYPRLLGKVARLGKRYASNNNCVVAACAQLSAEHIIRYSRAIQEHAQNMWTWVYDEKAREGSRIIEIKQLKSRNQKGFSFLLKEDFAHMRMAGINDNEAEKFRKRRKDKTPQKSKRQKPYKKERSKKILAEDDFIDLDEAA